MIRNTVANFIIHDLSCKHKMQEGLHVNSSVISDVVEGWNRNIYVVPHSAIKINKTEPKKYPLM